MKFHLLVCLLLASNSILAQQIGISWDPEIIVSDGSIYGNFRPRATIVQGDVPVVIYGNTGMENLFISRWNGSSFDAPSSILPPATSSYIADWTGPDIASKGDTVIAVFKLNPMETGNVYSVRSTDGGLTFSDTIRVDNHYSGNAWMPSMDIDSNGNPVVTYMAHDGPWLNPRYVIANSSDAGLSYNSEVEVVTVPGEACDCCAAEIVINGSKQLMLFRNNDNNVRDIHGVLSLDNGMTFPYQTNIDQLGWSIMGCPSTGSDGVFVGDKFISTYASASEGIYKVYLSSSDVSSSLTFENRVTVPAPVLGNDTQNFPRISHENDTVVMAWEEKDTGNKDIYYSVSVPGIDPLVGLTNYKWRANETTVGIQTNPEIIYKNGIVHLFFSENGSGDLIYRRGVVAATLDLSVNADESIEIFPNPSMNGSFDVRNIKKINSLVDAYGVKVSFENFQKGNSIELIINSNKKGIYFLNYTDKMGINNVQKIVVQ